MRRAGTGVRVAALLAAIAFEPRRGSAEDPKTPEAVPTTLEEATRQRLSIAFRRTPCFHERLVIRKKGGDEVVPPMYVELFREGPLVGIHMLADDPSTPPDQKPDPELGQGLMTYDGAEFRVAYRGEVVARMGGPSAIRNEWMPLVAALRSARDELEIANPAGVSPDELERRLDELRATFTMEVEPETDGRIRYSHGLAYETEPRWLSRALWDRSKLVASSPGFVAIRDGATVWRFRQVDGGLDGWESKHPANGSTLSATTTDVGWTTESWRVRIRRIAEQPSALAYSPWTFDLPRQALTAAVSTALEEDPRLRGDEKRLRVLASHLLRGFLRTGTVVASLPLSFEKLWPRVRRAIEEASGDDPALRARLIAAFEPALRDVVAAGLASLTPPGLK